MVHHTIARAIEFRLRQKRTIMTNTLAYFAKGPMTTKKSFKTLATERSGPRRCVSFKPRPGVKIIKTFFFVLNYSKLRWRGCL
jgi:hypothetical protein